MSDKGRFGAKPETRQNLSGKIFTVKDMGDNFDYFILSLLTYNLLVINATEIN